MLNDHSIKSGFGAALEIAVNKALAYDAGTQEALKKLESKLLQIEIIEPKSSFYFQFDNGEVRVLGYCEREIDCTLRGSLKNIVALVLQDDIHNLTNSGVEVKGDVALLMQISKIAKRVDIDWEEALTDVTGDLAGHQIALQIRRSAAWFKNLNQKAWPYLGEYLTEEIQAIPSELELTIFYDEVNQVRAHLERLERRLKMTNNRSPNKSA